MAGDLHHTAQPPTLAAFRPWGSSAGAGRVRPAAANIGKNFRRKRQDAEGTQRRKGNAETQRKRRDAKETQRRKENAETQNIYCHKLSIHPQQTTLNSQESLTLLSSLSSHNLLRTVDQRIQPRNTKQLVISSA